MLKNLRRRLLISAAVLTAGTSLIFDGCDPTVQATLEEGIINVSTSFLSSFLQAVIQVASEDTTAQVITQATDIFA